MVGEFTSRLISCITDTSCSTVRVPSEAPLPTCSDTPTIQTAGIALGTVQVPPQDPFIDSNVPACQTTGIAGRLSNLCPNLLSILTLQIVSLH